jgi:hypothetical protein
MHVSLCIWNCKKLEHLPVGANGILHGSQRQKEDDRHRRCDAQQQQPRGGQPPRHPCIDLDLAPSIFLKDTAGTILLQGQKL